MTSAQRQFLSKLPQKRHHSSKISGIKLHRVCAGMPAWMRDGYPTKEAYDKAHADDLKRYEETKRQRSKHEQRTRV